MSLPSLANHIKQQCRPTTLPGIASAEIVSVVVPIGRIGIIIIPVILAALR